MVQTCFLWKNWRTIYPVSFLHEEWQELTEWQIFGIITLHHGESQTQAREPLTVDHPNPSDNFHTSVSQKDSRKEGAAKGLNYASFLKLEPTGTVFVRRCLLFVATLAFLW